MDQVLSTFLGSSLFLVSVSLILAVMVPGMSEAKAKGILVAAGALLVLQVFIQASTLEPAQRVYLAISATVLIGVALRLFFLWAFPTEEVDIVALDAPSVSQPHFAIKNINRGWFWRMRGEQQTFPFDLEIPLSRDAMLVFVVTVTIDAYPPLCVGDIQLELNGQRHETFMGDHWAMTERYVSDEEMLFSFGIDQSFPCGPYQANLLHTDRERSERRSNFFALFIPAPYLED